MLCRNCGQSIVDAARFCSFCGAQQLVDASLQRPSSEALPRAPIPDSANEASDVTVILPRRRATAASAASTPGDEARPSAPTSTTALDKSEKPRPNITTMTIGGSAAVVVIAVGFAALFYANRPGPAPVEGVEVPPANRAQAVTAPTSTPVINTEADGASANAQAQTIPTIEPASAAKDAPTAEASGEPQALTQVPTNRVVVPSKDAAPRKKGPAPALAAPESAPIEAPAPTPVAITPPAPAPAAVSPPLDVPKVETVACADSSNPFSRELCLWQECAKPEYRSHSECARFSGPGNQR